MGTVIRLLAFFCVTVFAFAGQTNQSTGSEEALRGYIRTALEARSNSDFDAEVSAWRAAYVEASNLKSADGLFQAMSSLDTLFKDNERPMERTGILRSGVETLKKLGGAGALWGGTGRDCARRGT